MLQNPRQDLIQRAQNEILQTISKMHINGYVHGDLRPNNNIIQGTMTNINKITIIDFDWAGKIGEIRYPLYMNHAEIDWPAGASDNELIKPEHDVEMVQKLFDIYLILKIQMYSQLPLSSFIYTFVVE